MSILTAAFVNLSTIPSCSSDFDDHTRFVHTNQFGLSVQNLHRHEIFRFDSKKGAMADPMRAFLAWIDLVFVMKGLMERFSASITSVWRPAK